jgi:ribosome-associated protein
VADARTIATTCAKIAEETGGEDIAVLDLRGISSLADYFVLVSGTSVPHLKALVRDVRHGIEERLGESPRSAEGEATSLWLVIDYVDVVVHLLHEQTRSRYALEDLWSDAVRVDPSAEGDA